MLKCKIDIRN